MVTLFILLAITLILLSIAVYIFVKIQKYLHDIIITYNQQSYVLKVTDSEKKHKEIIMQLLAAVMRDGVLYGWTDMNMYLDEAEKRTEVCKEPKILS